MADQKKARTGASSKVEGVDLPAIERLLEFMGKHGLEEFEYERGDFRVRLKKASQNSGPSFRSVSSPEIVIAASGAAGGGSPAAAATKETPSDAGRGDDLHVINSPIVGTYYASS